jgi:hypothetical protein
MNKTILNTVKGNYNRKIQDYDHYIALDWSQDNVALYYIEINKGNRYALYFPREIYGKNHGGF